MGKLTGGPLVLYHLPKYWSRKPVIKNNSRILKKKHMHVFRPSLKHLWSFKRTGLKLWYVLRGQDTYSLYASVVLELKKRLS